MTAASRPGDATGAAPSSRTSRYIHANGADIYYVEAGQGPPLVLLHGAFVSTNPIWAGVPVAYAAHMARLAEHFRVIAPDTRGAGRTVHPGGGAVSFRQLADDVVALIEALELERPALCGFSEGAMTATIVGIEYPDVARAIVNDAGYDVFNPQAPVFQMGRQAFGGSPEATQPDSAAIERFFDSAEQLRPLFQMMKADYDGARGEGYWKAYFTQAFDRMTQSPGYTFADFQRIVIPTLILVGDRDDFCSVEEGVTAYRTLQKGELAILPATGHIITPLKIQLTIDFLRRAAS